MDEQLKFSWGHIIAFLALIFISYVTFVGVVYQTDGDFAKAAITMVAVDVVLVVVFIGSQMAKSTAHKFSKRIWLERIGIIASPFIFILCMLPYFHFWTVHSYNEEIIGNFTNAIKASNQMFKDYDDYANTRIDNYQNMLERVIFNRSIHPEQFAACGFSAGKEQNQKENMLKTLRLQLLSSNYDSLRTSADKWIESSSEGASTWNVFLLGNTKEIKAAIKDWNLQLCEFSEKKLSNEEFLDNEVTAFSESSQSLRNVENGLDSLTDLFIQKSFPNAVAIISAVLLYLAMLFPYILQDRHTKSTYRLFGMEKGYCRQNGDDIDIIMSQDENSSDKKKSNEKVIDDYESFNL